MSTTSSPISKESKTKTRNRRRSSVHEHAKKVSNMIDGLGKGISKGISAGVKKTKKFAIEKVVKVEASKESQEIIDTFNKLNEIKEIIDSLSDKTITNLYEQQHKESVFSLQLSEILMSLQSFQSIESEQNDKDDLFINFANNVMGRKLFKLNTMTNEYLVKMEKELINPIQIYKTKELSKSQQLIKEYESIKTDFDFANHKYQKLLNKKQDKNKDKDKDKDKKNNKISTAENKKNEKFKLLQEHRKKIVECVSSLECKQQINLLNCIEKFWNAYSIFSQRQHSIITLQDKNDELYQSQKKLIYGDDDDDDKKEEKDNDDNDNDDKTIFDEENENEEFFSDLTKSKSLRVALNNNDNQPLSKELRYKNPYKLGSGAFATVYRANDLLNNEQEVAIKKISIGDGDNVLYLSSTKEEAENELKIMKSLNGHKNIVALIDNYYEETVYNDLYLNLVMDYIPNTLLSQCEYYGESGLTIPHDLIQLYSFQLCRAVNHIHIKKIAHRDVKPENLLINPKTNELKLCDFGCSIKMSKRYNNDNNDTNNNNNDENLILKDDDDDLKEKDGNFQSYICSRYYRAPELILQSGFYDCKIDIWSIGCVIAEMFLGTLLFEGDNNENDHLNDIIKKLGTPTEQDIDDMNPDYLYKQDLLEKDEMGESWDMLFCVVESMPIDAINLISQTLIYSPNSRISALNCLKSQYFKGLKNNEKFKQIIFDWTDLEIRYAKINGVELE